ncbi:MAG: GDP-mannose 4,6-dehydratase [Candidatus Pacebacteria bacterium]|nr:GDP-mannose 4,6-dehydratase [Candidatus Paceibacterota bacterium]
MKYQKILITGGAGFVGANLAIDFKKKYPQLTVIALDNLKRRGAELNINRLKEKGVEFVHGDVRCPEDLSGLDLGKNFLMIECSAEPSVLAGVNSSPEYLLNTNLMGAINCFEMARKSRADVIFLSTSRVYPIEPLTKLKYKETPTRYALDEKQPLVGVSEKGISEKFSLEGARSLYGATKLCSELIFQEYQAAYGLRGVINRCGVITGPWQMGKVDQGVVVLWMARHFFGGNLSYIGYGGKGKQVRDFIHVKDLFDLLDQQVGRIDKYDGQVFNVGGGVENSFSLLELTRLCRQVTDKKIKLGAVKETRPNDIRIYLTDSEKVKEATGWKPKIGLEKTLEDIHRWLIDNRDLLAPILS